MRIVSKASSCWSSAGWIGTSIPASTLQVVDAMLEADKNFEFVL